MSSPLSPKLDWALANPIWASALNPVISNPILSGKQLSGIVLSDGSTTINHGLGRNMQGWFITDINAAATIYRSKAMNNSTLTLTSSAVATVNIWVY